MNINEVNINEVNINEFNINKVDIMEHICCKLCFKVPTLCKLSRICGNSSPCPGWTSPLPRCTCDRGCTVSRTRSGSLQHSNTLLAETGMSCARGGQCTQRPCSKTHTSPWSDKGVGGHGFTFDLIPPLKMMFLLKIFNYLNSSFAALLTFGGCTPRHCLIFLKI